MKKYAVVYIKLTQSRGKTRFFLDSWKIKHFGIVKQVYIQFEKYLFIYYDKIQKI
jgi:hypothetical protein